MRTSILLLLSLFTAQNGIAQTPRTMTTDDGLNMVNIGGALMSPDDYQELLDEEEA